MPTASWFDSSLFGSLKPTATALVDQLGNSLLQFDPETLTRLDAFRGKVFCLDITEPKMRLHLHPSQAGIRIEFADDSKDEATKTIPDVTLRGSLWAFIRLANSDDSKAAFHSGRVQMQGDAELGQAFQAVLTDLDIDWEEVLSRVIGDRFARQAGRFFDQIQQSARQSAQTARHNLGEVLQEELKLTPHPVEMENFTNEVEALRSDVARLEARLRKLAQ